MQTLRDIFSQEDFQRFTDYISFGRKLEKLFLDRQVSAGSSIRVAYLSSGTSNGVSETLVSLCSHQDVFPEIYVGPYGQYAQEVLDIQSGLYAFDPELVFIHVDLQSLAGNYYFDPYQISTDERCRWSQETLSLLLSMVNKLNQKLVNAKVVISNLEIPVYSPLGIVEDKQSYGFIESVEDINRSLREIAKEKKQVYVYDFNGFCSRLGKRHIVDSKMYYMGDIKLSPHLLPELCRDYSKYILAASSKTKKCLVLDLDNTLWGGIVGESGLMGIGLGPTSDGRSFLEFQKYLLALHNRGVILAVNSKNNFDDAMDVIQNHPHMVLKKEHFAAIRINWNDKVSNLKSIADEINIGLDSLVFLDDDPVNRDMVRELLPEVEVVDLPKDFSHYVRTLQDITYFETLILTSEDRDKGKMYQADRLRRELATSSSDIADYLRLLNMQVSIAQSAEDTIPRIAQLTQKTNQFNLTTRRYTEEKITEFHLSDNYEVYSISVTDKYGDNGLTGVAIIEKRTVGNSWHIDSFLLSCRVLGRCIEDVLMTHIKTAARDSGASFVTGEFIPTKKNMPAGNLFKEAGYSKISDKDGIENWQYDLDNEFHFPDFIEYIIVRKNSNV